MNRADGVMFYQSEAKPFDSFGIELVEMGVSSIQVYEAAAWCTMDRAVYTTGSPTFDPDDLDFDSGCETWKIQTKEDIKQLPKREDFRRKMNCFIVGTSSVKIRAGHIQNRVVYL